MFFEELTNTSEILSFTTIIDKASCKYRGSLSGDLGEMWVGRGHNCWTMVAWAADQFELLINNDKRKCVPLFFTTIRFACRPHRFFGLTMWQVSVSLKFPVSMSKFLQAVPVSATDFVGRWRALSGPPTKLQEVVGIGSVWCGWQFLAEMYLSLGELFWRL